MQAHEPAQQQHRTHHRPDQLCRRTLQPQLLEPCGPDLTAGVIDYELRLVSVSETIEVAVMKFGKYKRGVAVLVDVVGDVRSLDLVWFERVDPAGQDSKRDTNVRGGNG